MTLSSDGNQAKKFVKGIKPAGIPPPTASPAPAKPVVPALPVQGKLVVPGKMVTPGKPVSLSAPVAAPKVAIRLGTSSVPAPLSSVPLPPSSHEPTVLANPEDVKRDLADQQEMDTYVHPPASSLPQQGLQSRKVAETGVFNLENVPSPLVGKPASHERIIEAEIEEFKEQLQNYVELCDSISGVNWQPLDIVDIVHLLVRSIGFDTVSLVLSDLNQPEKMLPVVSRGYKTPPVLDIIPLWEKCLVPEMQTLNWAKLMSLAGDTDTALARWIVHEDLYHVGYAPVHDGGKIFGFIFVGNHEKSRILSPFASQLLELTGSRLGLSLGLMRNRGNWPASVLEKAKLLRDQFSLLMGYMDLMRASGGMSPEEISVLAGKCRQTLDESVHLLDIMTMEAAGGGG